MLEERRLSHDHRQWVIEFVGHTRQQLAHGGKLLALMERFALLLQLRLAPPTLGDIALYGDEVGDVALLIADGCDMPFRNEFAAVFAIVGRFSRDRLPP